MAKGRSEVIDVYCNNCGNQLYRYEKDRPGRLIKLYDDMIREAYVPDIGSETHDPFPEIPEGIRLHELDALNLLVTCPFCQQEIARVTGIHGRLAYKIIQGKVRVR